MRLPSTTNQEWGGYSRFGCVANLPEGSCRHLKHLILTNVRMAQYTHCRKHVIALVYIATYLFQYEHAFYSNTGMVHDRAI